MAIKILLLLISIPLAEIIVFIELGSTIGLWPTVGTIIFTAILGTIILRKQGLETLKKVQSKILQNHLPISEVFDGLCLLIAGIFLLTPGFITDSLGFLLLFPPFRIFLKRFLTQYWIEKGTFKNYTTTSHSKNDNDNTIEGEYIEINPEHKDTK